MESLLLIVGLGNPGADYERTRHNAGFLVVEELAQRAKAGWNFERKFSARVAKAERDGLKVLFAEPQTFMNLSGQSVAALLKFYQVPLAQLLVVVDDADLPFGQIRLKPKGSSGGHHGLESIEQHVGSREFARLKVGIGRQDQSVRQIAGHVLAPFGAGERELLEKILQKACEQIECWLAHGTAKAMNQFNGAVKL